MIRIDHRPSFFKRTEPAKPYTIVMVDDIEFSRLADAFMNEVFEALLELDPDELDPDLAMGVITMEFADGTKCILNRQAAAHQIWLAYGASAWHFNLEASSWVDTKGRGELKTVLAEVISKKLGRSITL